MRERRAGFCLSFVGTLIGEIVGIFEIVSSRKGGEDAKGFFLVSLLKYITLPPSKNGDCRWASNKTEKSRGRFGVRRNIFLRRTGYFYLVF